jgi:Icc-related predicted phosphoesterase
MEVKICVISDTHNRHKKIIIPPCDILIHCGDFSGQGRKSEVKDFFKWFSRQHQAINKVLIAGNHDRSFDPKFYADYDTEEWLPDLMKEYNSSFTYLENESTEICGLKIWGSPVTPWFHGEHWAFNKHRGEEIRQVWANIPRDTDIIVTHGPVACKCDYTEDKEYAGCEDLRYITKMIKPKLVCGGHIHEAYGVEEDNDTIYVNASTCNLRYDPVNKPIEIILDI